MNKVLVKIYVPKIEKSYDVLIPVHKRIYNVILQLTRLINELNNGEYLPDTMPKLYNRLTAEEYDINLNIKESNIRNATELILL